MGQLEDLMARRNAVAANIEKACNTGFDLNQELEKARSGVYADTAENRKMNRVGQKYGSEKKEEEPKGQKEKKQEEEGSGKTVSEHAAGASDEALKRAAADEKASPEVKAAAEEEMKKRGSEKKEEKGKENKKEEKGKEEKESERNKQRFVRDIIKNGAGKSTDDFMDENIEYYKDVLDQYGAKDLFDLSQKFEEKYENDEKDPYGYERYGKIYIKCMKQIPAEKFNNQ